MNVGLEKIIFGKGTQILVESSKSVASIETKCKVGVKVLNILLIFTSFDAVLCRYEEFGCKNLKIPSEIVFKTEHLYQAPVCRFSYFTFLWQRIPFFMVFKMK